MVQVELVGTDSFISVSQLAAQDHLNIQLLNTHRHTQCRSLNKSTVIGSKKVTAENQLIQVKSTHTHG